MEAADILNNVKILTESDLRIKNLVSLNIFKIEI